MKKEVMTKEEAINFFRDCLSDEVSIEYHPNLPITPQPEMGQWIPTSEKLPEIYQDVLLTLKNSVDIEFRRVDIGFRGLAKPYFYCYSVDGHYVELQNVLAWMPLPEMYKEG